MRSNHSKVVQLAAGKPLIRWVAEALSGVGATEQVYIVGHRQEEVREVLGEDVAFVFQEHQLGTGHAVMQAAPFLEGRNGCTIVLPGDAPLITSETISKALEMFEQGDFGAVIITGIAPDPKGYGRIVRNDDGNVMKIVEDRDCNEQERMICEINSSIYCFKTPLLLSALGRIDSKNAQKEYYLTDTIEILIRDGHKVGAYIADFDETRGVNDRVELQAVGKMLNRRVCEKLMREGVQIVDTETTWIADTVKIGKDTISLPGCVLLGNTVIGDECEIGENSRLENVVLGDGSTVDHSIASDCVIGKNCRIGPYSHLRPDTELKDNVTIGAYVEVKNATIGDYSRARHLTYVGDAKVGKNVNFGCGTVTCNYDGMDKTWCVIGDNVFIGGNSNLISPVTLKENSYIAAGSTITEDVPELGLALARSQQVVKENWVAKKNRSRASTVIQPDKKRTSGM